MNAPTALDSFLDKWRDRWPEWSVAEAFVAEAERDRTVAWFSLLQEFDDILNIAGDPTPADAKLGWWASELRDWSTHRSRHPLGRLLEPVPAPWAQLADALLALVAAREPQIDADAALASLSIYAEAVCDVEAVLLGGARPESAALAAQVLAARLAEAGPLAVPHAFAANTADDEASRECTRQEWARELLGRWPVGAGGSRARRIYARLARHRLEQLAAGRTSQPGRRLMGDLWRAWRAASGGP